MKRIRLLSVILILVLVLALTACAPKSGTATPAGTVSATSAGSSDTPAAAATTAGGQGAAGDCNNPFLPVAKGNSWTYSSTGAGFGDYSVTESISDLSGAGFTMDYKASTGVDATIKWTCQGGNLTALDAGTSGGLSVSTSNVQIKSDSVKVTGYNLPASFGPGSTWTITESVEATASAAGKSVDSQLAYTLNCSYGDAESVTVPAGTFSALKANCTKDSTMSAVVSGKSMQLNDTKENVTYWYVKGVGQVKTVYSGGKDDQTVVLEKYTVN